MKKVLSIFIVITLLFSNFTPFVYAQEEMSDDSTSSAKLTIETILEASPEANLQPTPSPSSIFEEPLDIEPSASIRGKLKVRDLLKTNFRADEKLTIIVENTLAPDTQVKLFNVDGQEVPVVVEVINEINPTVLSISPNYQLRAGRYRVEITDPEGNVTTQDFTWGVLAINTNKSIYLSAEARAKADLPAETAKLQMAVLDETGMMVCDAKVNLKIQNPKSEILNLSTQDGSIKVNPECWIKEFTLTPDYEATYQVGEAGEYNMTLTAETRNGTYTITDSFEVKDFVALDVERVSSTRLFPPITYPVTFNITANEDFSGVVSEKVPAIFAITPLSGTVPTSSIDESKQPVLGTLNPEIPQLGLPFDAVWPISQTFGSPPDDPILAEKYTQYGVIGHDGVDFAAPEGVAILAVDDGEVIYAQSGEYGKMVVIQHAWGRSYYGHMSEITSYVGQKRTRGFPIGMVGSTGLATGAHLHLGIKPNDADENNGYLGKINPLPYLGLVKDGENGGSYFIGTPSDGSAFTTLNWNVTLKKGESIKLGYNFKVPNISPQFYNIGPLEFKNADGKLVFAETRLWQLAVDADGSGANNVDPAYGVVSDPDRIYTFTFTASATMDSGGITMVVPAGWSAPQGSAGVAGRVVATTTGNATVGTVWNSADATTNWTYDDTDYCQGSVVADTTVKQEGTASIKCDANGGSPDPGDTFGLDIANQDWSIYSQVSYWMRSDDGRAAGALNAVYDNATTCAAPTEEFAVSALTADTWTYQKHTLTATRTDVDSFCIEDQGGGDVDIVWIDEILLGPGVPTFSGSGPWIISARILDAASTETIILTYGSGGGTSGVDNSSTQGLHTFTTQSRELVTGTLTNISAHPTITLVGSMVDLMRHGNWFNSSGVEQYFVF